MGFAVRMLLRRIARAVWPVLISVPLLAAGCGTLADGRGWGQDALWPIDPGRVGRAARDALLSPGTLVPLAGAAVFAIDDFDERLSDWALEHTPIFGSPECADDASNYLWDVLQAEALVMPLATPSGDTMEQWAPTKLRGYAVELGAIAATGSLTNLLKDATRRERPDESDDRSFPSGHTSMAFSCATLANRNLDYIDALEQVRRVLEVANTVLAAGVGWARVEAGKHYPSDVLFGAALGHFLVAFIHDAFMNLPEGGRVDFGLFPVEDGGGIQIAFRF